MNLSLFTISRKIFAIPVVAIIFFGVYLVMSYQVSSKNLKNMDSIYNIDFKALIIAKELMFDMERIDDELTQAAMAGEQESLDIALSRQQIIGEKLKQLANLPAPTQAVDKITSAFNVYFNLAIPLSRSLVEGSVDYLLLPEKSKQKVIAYNDLNKILSAFIANRNKTFNDAFESMANSVETQIFIGLFAGLLMALFLILIALPVVLAVNRHLRAVVSSLKKIAIDDNGDLTLRLTKNSDDEIGELVHWFNQFVARLDNVVSRLILAFKLLENLIANIDQVVDSMGNTINKQKSDCAEANSVVTTINKHVADIELSSNSAAKNAEKAAQVAIESSQKLTMAALGVEQLEKEIQSAQQVISALADDVQQVGNVLDVINGIAEQTNLLALNAAIEAARAGEQGRGFAVVADEVRNLAIKTQQSTHEIESTISLLKDAANKSVNVMKNSVVLAKEKGEITKIAGVEISKMTEEIQTISRMNHEIAQVCKEQGIAVNQLERVIDVINQHSKTAAKESANLSDISHELIIVTERVSREVSVFTVNEIILK